MVDPELALCEQGWLKVPKGIIPLSEQQRPTHTILIQEVPGG